MRTSPRYGRAFADWFARKLGEMRANREDPKLSDSKAAELIGVSHAMVSRFLAAVSLPSRATARALVIGLNAQRVPATLAEVEQLVEESDPGRYHQSSPSPGASAEIHNPAGPPAGVISLGSARLVVDDPREMRFLLSQFAYYRGLTEEERASLEPDEREIVAPPTPADREGEDAGGRRMRARGPR